MKVNVVTDSDGYQRSCTSCGHAQHTIVAIEFDVGNALRLCQACLEKMIAMIVAARLGVPA